MEPNQDDVLSPQEEENLELLLLFGAPPVATDCVDENAIDQADLLAYAEGPIAAEIAQRLQVHLGACAYCQALLAEYRDITRAKRSRRRLLGAGALAAGIAAVGLVAGMVARTRPTGLSIRYTVARVKGAGAAVMGGPGDDDIVPPEPWRFVPESRVEIVLAPQRELERDAAHPKLAIYVADGAGRLARVHGASIVASGSARFPSFRVSASGAQLFGGGARGANRLVFLFAADDSVLERAAGRTLEDARMMDGLELVARDVVYE